ncbi:MAG TPA: FGGY-family carbohydrate kinase [Candidatus Binataceae bacterium]|nr:FGGY-family carbohydrate kinase [Candidatus Binataceae bacterium]
MTTSDDRYVLAIDMGSGSAKAALVSNAAEIVASRLGAIRTIFRDDGGVEQDPGDYWSAVVSAARTTLGAAGIAPDRIIAVACTTQWAVTIPVDEAGQALMNAVSWMDTRGGKYNRALSAGWPRIQGYGLFKALKWVRLSGGAPVATGADGLGHIQFIRNERPDIYARTHKFLEPMDYLNLRLTGRFAASYATMFTYWATDNRDPRRIDYSPELLKLSNLERAKLPDLFPVDHVLGTLTAGAADELGLAHDTRVVMGSCDLQSAAIGAGAIEDFDGYIYIGTTSWISCHIPARKTDPVHMLSSMPAAIAGRYIVTAEQGVAGRCLEFLKDLLYPDCGASSDPYAEMNQLAAAIPPGSDGLIFTPWLAGVLAPSEDSATRSAFFNQTIRTTRGHYVRAVMEGIAFNLRWLKGYVEKFIGHPFHRLGFIGGGAQSDLWCQILADILDCPVRQVAGPRNANAVGAAMAAFVALGGIKLGEIPARIRISRVYDPCPENRKLYDARFREFMEIYRRNRPIYRRLNALPRRA